MHGGKTPCKYKGEHELRQPGHAGDFTYNAQGKTKQQREENSKHGFWEKKMGEKHAFVFSQEFILKQQMF